MAGTPEPAETAAPVAEFAAALRALREAAGSPTYRRMQRAAGVSLGALHQAARGGAFPTLRVTLAFVRACAGDAEEWERRWQAAKERIEEQPRPEEDGTPAPYRGLARYEPEDAGLFFGREQLIGELLALTRRFRICALLGASGSGKSSLLRAGLIPALRAPEGADPRPARVVILTPGAHPAAEHRERLAPAAAGTDGPPEGPPDEPRGETVVLVDQFEELFTLCADPAEREDFLRLLLAARDPESGLRVVLALRADFLAHCARHTELAEALRRATLLLGPMSAEELQQAVVRPAAARGLQVQRALTARVVAEVAGEPGALPLMSHALLETWRHRRGNLLTETAYEAAGGLHGALAKTAEDAYAGFGPREAARARRVLLRLVSPGEGGPDTRRPLPHAELAADAAGQAPEETATVVDRLVAARLLTRDETVVDLAHEALLTAWPRLRGWIDAERDRLRLHRRLSRAARDWRALDREPSALYLGSRLTAVEEAFPAADRAAELTAEELEFLTASQRRRQRGRRRRQALTAVLCALTLLAGCAAAVAFRERSAAHAERDTAIFHQIATAADNLRGEHRAGAARLDAAAYAMADTPDLDTRLLGDAGASLSSALPGHDGVVSAASFAPGGRLLASGGHDRTVRLWDTADPLRARPLRAPLGPFPDRVEDVQFASRGGLLAVALHDGTVRLLDLSEPRRPRTLGRPLAAHRAPVAMLRLAPDGRTLATASDDGTVRLWDLAQPARPRPLGPPLPAHRGGARALAFAPDGATLASGGYDGRIRLWDLSDPRRARQRGAALTGHGEPVWSLAFSPDGATLASGGFDGTARLWNLTDPGHPRRGPVLDEPGAPVWSVAFSPDGSTLAAGGEDNAVRLWTVLDPGHPLPLDAPMTGHRSGIWSVQFRPGDARTLVSAGYQGDLLLWHRPPGQLTGFTNPLTSAAYRPDGRVLAVASTDDALIRLWDVHDPLRPRLLGLLRGHRDRVTSVAFAPDGRTLASAGEDDTVRLWDTADPARARPLGPPLTGHRDGIRAVAFAPRGHTLAGGGRDGTLRLWSLADRARPKPLGRAAAPREGHINALAFAPDGRTLATAHQRSAVRLWGLRGTRDPRPLRKLTGHQEGVRAVAFSPDGSLLASGGEDRTLRLWKTADPEHAAATGRPRTGHGSQINALAFSPGGDRLATAGGDTTVRLWRVTATGATAWGQPLTGHTRSVSTVVFSPDGRTLASGGDDLTARLWPLDVAGALRQVCARTRGSLDRAAWRARLPQVPYAEPCGAGE
ncbi:WD40 repeat domain-containing protein [Streptomyces physcomitrii]|uniref:WD40 repeat domain-containing protein n=1 Tax=Streptomyces physcomitrii TaxID=2724184 RepID=UPI00340F5010